jgi:hypothetical protein
VRKSRPQKTKIQNPQTFLSKRFSSREQSA